MRSSEAIMSRCVAVPHFTSWGWTAHFLCGPASSGVDIRQLKEREWSLTSEQTQYRYTCIQHCHYTHPYTPILPTPRPHSSPNVHPSLPPTPTCPCCESPIWAVWWVEGVCSVCWPAPPNTGGLIEGRRLTWGLVYRSTGRECARKAPADAHGTGGINRIMSCLSNSQMKSTLMAMSWGLNSLLRWLEVLGS